MLGKGLESLIPPQKKNDDGSQSGGNIQNQPQGNANNPAASSGVGGHQPQPQSQPQHVPDNRPDLPKQINEPEREFLPPHMLAEEAKPEPVAPNPAPQKQPEPQQAAEPHPASRPSESAPITPFHDRAPGGGEAVFQIETEKIKPNPHQPRRVFDDDALRDLAASIREFGILQPVVVSKRENETPHGVEVEYELVAGERRLMASKLLGLERVPAIVRRVNADQEKLEMAIIENLQRENLSPIEMGRAFQRLQEEFRLTQREIASRLGKSREVVANTVRLLDLPPRIQDAISRGEITESHGRLLLSVPDPKAQQQLFEDLISRHLSTRELRERVDEKKERTPKRSIFDDPEFRALQEKLTADFGTPVTISQSGQAGKITIAFYSKEELDNILRRFGAGNEGGDGEPPLA